MRLPELGHDPWALELALREALGAWPLRWAIAEVGPEPGALWIEGAAWWGGPDPRPARRPEAPGPWLQRGHWAALIPTGVGAEWGGYAGDAGPWLAALAALCPGRLWVNPNAANAASLSALPPGVGYVEGRAFDDWALGRWDLLPAVRQRVGLLIDRGVEAMPEGSLALALQGAEAVAAVHGVELVGYTLSPRPFGVRVGWEASGASGGAVDDPEALLEGAQALLARGATAIAVMAALGPLGEEALAAYEAGQGVDPIGGVEAILSHAVVAALGVPCAHAPLWGPELPLLEGDARAAAEAISPSFLPCVLQGLRAHPALVPPGQGLGPEALSGALYPAGALGGPGALALAARGKELIEVVGNRTVLRCTGAPGARVARVADPLAALGWVAAAEAGVPGHALARPMVPLPRI